MSCEPHPQVLSPCADDSVSNGQMLGAQGDISAQEYGEYALTQGVTEVDVLFDFEKQSALYVFEYLYVRSSDDSPDSITAVPYSQTAKRFKAKLSGAPQDGHSTLVWRVKIPDPLRTICVGNGPQYAIIPVEQHGVTPLVNGQDFIIVTFAEPMPDNNWVFEALSFEKAFSEADALGFVPTVTAHTVNGFTLQFQGAPDSSDYTMRWQVRGVT